MTASTAPARPDKPRAVPHSNPTRHAFGCFPGCACKCNNTACACRENPARITEPSAAEREQGAQIGPLN